MIQAYASFWKNYVNFKGRASRGQYWWVVLANALINAGSISEVVRIIVQNGIILYALTKIKANGGK